MGNRLGFDFKIYNNVNIDVDKRSGLVIFCCCDN